MRNLVLSVALAALACAFLAIGGMVAIAMAQGDGLASTVISDLQTIALAVIPPVIVVISHYIGSQAQAQANGAPAPAEPPAAPGGA